ncbi:MAG TPA: SRPBCC domain-containing protein [Conexibacter sp.]|nr:SRPBCC domain-containing protein [Conexibacter sp.]
MTDLELETETTSLRLERTFDAPVEDVFDAWTNPEVLRRWWNANPSWAPPSIELDLRPGGAYRFSMRDTESGEMHTVVGEYREVQRPQRLVYSWAWEGTGPYAGHESLVTVDFRAEGERTTVVLEHARLRDAQSREAHGHGWNAVLDKLAAEVFGSARTS